MTGIENLKGTFESLSLQGGEEINSLLPLAEPFREENILTLDKNHNPKTLTAKRWIWIPYLNNNKVQMQQFRSVDELYNPIFQLINNKSKKPKRYWLNPFKTCRNDILLMFLKSRRICDKETYVEVMKLALFSELWDATKVCNKNIKPNGIFREIES